MKKVLLFSAILALSGCTKIYLSHPEPTTEEIKCSNGVEGCDWNHLSQSEIEGLNALAERKYVDSSLVNAVFEEDMRCGQEFRLSE